MRSPSIIPLLSTFAVAAFSLFSAVLSPIAHANLVVNGGFEAGSVADPSFGGTASGGGDAATINGSLAGWDVGPSTNGPNALATNQNSYFATASNGNPVNALSGPHNGLLHGNIPFDPVNNPFQGGNVSAVFPNFPDYNGYISQQVTGVVAGSIYRISFWLANQIGDNANNYMTVKWGGDIASPGAAITGGNSLFGDGGNPANPTLPGAIPVPTNWTYYEFITGAPSTDARLSFIGGNTAAGTLIDDVSVEFYAVPEVSSFGMLIGFGLLALGTMGRMRRRSFATA